MQTIRNDWTPLFEDLREKLNSESRTELLFQTINELRRITQNNFGEDGEDRPKPWKILSKKYADRWKYGNRTPTLQMSDEKHALKNPNLPHLLQMFRVDFNSEQAVLTNESPYADAHQLGYGVSARPYYPVSGNELTPYATEKVREILSAHFESFS